VLSMEPFGKGEPSEDLKGFGYGVPLRVRFAVDGGERLTVLGTMTPNPFGHDHFSDRAQVLLWEHDTFNRLPRHVRSLDVGAFTKAGGLVSLGETEEFFLLTEFAAGDGYFHDLERLVPGGEAQDLDVARARALADYLAAIHQVKKSAPSLYVRRIRDLIGHGECLMGIIDNYPREFGFITQDLLQRVEERCVAWRWRLKPLVHRLSQVHGDFHPWNILFREGIDFTVLDRSRGEWGEPADDLGSLFVNYLFCSLRRYGRLDGPFETLFRTFWETYLKGSGDEEILRVIPPFLAWRALVVASPVWYPTIPMEVRRKLFSLIENILEAEVFDPGRVNGYLEEG
ncbi:MAG: phosphotransferase, partial [Nitrospirae bacterium]|nr:phosphotransferase [Nitrospirota bacterium]